MKKIISLLIILCVLTPMIAEDTYTVDAEFVSKLYNKVRNLEHSDSLKTDKINVQILIIENQDKLISQLKERSKIDSMRVELYKEQAQLNKPSFGERKELGFVYGAGLILGSSGVVSNVK